MRAPDRRTDLLEAALGIVGKAQRQRVLDAVRRIMLPIKPTAGEVRDKLSNLSKALEAAREALADVPREWRDRIAAERAGSVRKGSSLSPVEAAKLAMFAAMQRGDKIVEELQRLREAADAVTKSVPVKDSGGHREMSIRKLRAAEAAFWLIVPDADTAETKGMLAPGGTKGMLAARGDYMRLAALLFEMATGKRERYMERHCSAFLREVRPGMPHWREADRLLRGFAMLTAAAQQPEKNR